MPAQPPISAVVLAGGRSRRLGRDKALLSTSELGFAGPDRTLLELVLDRVRAVAVRALVVADSPGRFAHLDVPVIADEYPGAGSLGGLCSGLAAVETSYTFVVACDMPFLSPALLRRMSDEPRDYDVLIPRLGSHVEPLHAIYSRACLGPARRLIARGDLRIIDFFPDVAVRYMQHPVLDALDPRHLSFMNINRPEDLDAVRLELTRDPALQG